MRSIRVEVSFVACSVALASFSYGQGITRVSVDSAGVQCNELSERSSISSDGRFVAFESSASNLVSYDTNDQLDVFVHDRSTGTTERVSVSSLGFEGDDASFASSISADGQRIVFSSWATNLTPADVNQAPDVFVHDRSTRTTSLVSVATDGAQGNSTSSSGTISADNRYIAFSSLANNLVIGDTNATDDVFVRDLVSATTIRASVSTAGVQGNGRSYDPSISDSGSVIVFMSAATNLAGTDLNCADDVFVHSLSVGQTSCVSVDLSGLPADGFTFGPNLSADGNLVVFSSTAANLIVGDTNSATDVFLRDLLASATERMSVDSEGLEHISGASDASISPDGRFVGFMSGGQFSPDAVDFVFEAFARDRDRRITTRVSARLGSENDARSENLSFSFDGSVIAFDSTSDLLVRDDKNGGYDVYVRENAAIEATWSNYGTGFPGTLGIPSLVLGADPVIGTTMEVDLGNSSGGNTIGLMFVGRYKTLIHGSWGGDVLVVPVFSILVNVPAAGATIQSFIPNDEAICGIPVLLQVLELDLGAARNISSTAGLEIICGH